MNTYKKFILATLVVGVAAQSAQAFTWTPRTIAAVTLAGLGLGTASAIKYYGLNSVAQAVLEKCANAKNWLSDKISNTVYGSYIKRINSLRQAHTEYLEQQIEEQAMVKESIKGLVTKYDEAIFRAKQLALEYSKLLKEKERVEALMRGIIAGNESRAIHRIKNLQQQNERLQQELYEKQQMIDQLQEVCTQMQTTLVDRMRSDSDENTSNSSDE